MLHVYSTTVDVCCHSDDCHMRLKSCRGDQNAACFMRPFAPVLKCPLQASVCVLLLQAVDHAARCNAAFACFQVGFCVHPEVLVVSCASHVM